MKISEKIECVSFPCIDVDIKSHIVPDISLDPEKVQMLMISEAPSVNPHENFYSKNNEAFLQSVFQIFKDAGLEVSSIQEFLDYGIYITTAIKCPKKGLSVSTDTIKTCSLLLEREFDSFPNIKVLMLNGDVAIRVMNYILKRKDGTKVIPAGSTYKIRKEKFYYKTIRVFPSYILTGKNLLIEKSKRRMITEDLQEAFKCL